MIFGLILQPRQVFIYNKRKKSHIIKHSISSNKRLYTANESIFVLSRNQTKNVKKMKFQIKSKKESKATVNQKEFNDIQGLQNFLNSIKWDKNNLVPVIVQHVDTGEILMQAFADKTAIAETLKTKMATFYSRSRQGRWCKGETSGNFINVLSFHLDCDRDSVIYISDPIGPTCHTNAENCYFYQFQINNGNKFVEDGNSKIEDYMPKSTLLALQDTIKERSKNNSVKSWTVKLLSNPNLLCEKIKEEASELCKTLEENEGSERTAEEMADLLYHSLVLLNKQGVGIKEVLRVLRGRFGVSGLEEKANRNK